MPKVIEYDKYANSWASEYRKFYCATHEKAVELFKDIICEKEYYGSAQMSLDAFNSGAKVRYDGAKPSCFGIVLPSDMLVCSNMSGIIGFKFVR